MTHSNESAASLKDFKTQLILIDSRALERDCFKAGVEAAQKDTSVTAFATVDDWIKAVGDFEDCDAILFNVEGRRFSSPDLVEDVTRLVRCSRRITVIVISPYDELSEMVAALDCGAKGYLSTSLGILAALGAVPLAKEGALCLPASSITGIRKSIQSSSVVNVQSQFTPRQLAVAEALRRGKPNKVIAYELNMCESTVKVHIRTIMKRLGAANRTEAGFKLNSLASGSLELANSQTGATQGDARGGHTNVAADNVVEPV